MQICALCTACSNSATSRELHTQHLPFMEKIYANYKYFNPFVTGAVKQLYKYVWLGRFLRMVNALLTGVW